MPEQDTHGRSEHITLRVSKVELDWFEFVAETRGITRSEAIRDLATERLHQVIAEKKLKYDKIHAAIVAREQKKRAT